MKETEFEIDCDRIKREKSDVEMAIKLRIQNQKKKDEEKLKKNSSKKEKKDDDDQTDKESVLTKTKSKYSTMRMKAHKKNKLNEDSQYGSQLDPEEAKQENQAKNEEKYSEHDGKNTLEM